MKIPNKTSINMVGIKDEEMKGKREEGSCVSLKGQKREKERERWDLGLGTWEQLFLQYKHSLYGMQLTVIPTKRVRL